MTLLNKALTEALHKEYETNELVKCKVDEMLPLVPPEIRALGIRKCISWLLENSKPGSIKNPV